MNQRDGYDAHTAAGDALPTRAAPSRTSSASSSSPVSTLIRDGARRRRSSSISKAGSNSSSSVVEAAVFPAGNSHAVDTFAGASQSRHQRSMRQNDASSNSASGGSSEKNSFSQAEAMQRTNSAGSYSDGGLSDESENVLAPSSRSPSASGSKTTAKRPKLSRAERDRLKTKRFAREMTFVTVPSILLSMVGSVMAGEVLARMKHWSVFLRVEELFILVPILLNLKGNLEMNLAARFSTSANIGELDHRTTRRSLVLGNLALLQVQALAVSLLAGLVAFVLGLMSRHGLANSPAALTGHDIQAYGVERGGYFEALLVLTASMTSASASSAVVGAFMCALVIISRFLRINPDNLATPLAASLGDLLTLIILGLVANIGANVMASFVSTIIFAILIIFVALMVLVTIRNAYVQELIWAGWIPLLLALGVSSGTGLILQAYVNQYRGFGLIAPVVTGVAGNVGAIFVSRISTALHGAKEERYLLTAGTLFVISSPILMAFLAFIWLTGQVKIGIAFAFSYTLLSAAVIIISLSIGYFLTFWLWQRDYDPDINALPLLSSAVDLCGQLLLVVAFSLASWLGGDVLAPSPAVTIIGNLTTIVNTTSAAVIRH